MFSYIVALGLAGYFASKSLKDGVVKRSSLLFKPTTLLAKMYDYCESQMRPFLLETKRSFNAAYEQAARNRGINKSVSSVRVTYDDALEIFGFSPRYKPSDDEIRTKFKELMLQFHPDRGGNKFFAAQVIEAKRVLSGE